MKIQVEMIEMQKETAKNLCPSPMSPGCNLFTQNHQRRKSKGLDSKLELCKISIIYIILWIIYLKKSRMCII